jgi:hypothetical protein
MICFSYSGLDTLFSFVLLEGVIVGLHVATKEALPFIRGKRVVPQLCIRFHIKKFREYQNSTGAIFLERPFHDFCNNYNFLSTSLNIKFQVI